MIQTPAGPKPGVLRDPKCPEHGRKAAEPVNPPATVHYITHQERVTFLAQVVRDAIDDFWLEQAGYVY